MSTQIYSMHVYGIAVTSEKYVVSMLRQSMHDYLRYFNVSDRKRKKGIERSNNESNIFIY